MNPRVSLVVVLFAVFALVGCSAKQQHEDAARELVAVFNEYADVLETVKDTATADAAAPRIEANNDRFEKLIAKMKDLPKITKSDDEALLKEFKPKMIEAAQRMGKTAFSAGVAGRKSTKFVAAIKRMEAIGKKAPRR